MNLSIANWHLSVKLLVIALAMFGFGYAMVPIYRAICEVTGVGLMTQRDEKAAEFARNTQVDTSRSVVVEFDANSRGAWVFRPKVPSVTVHPGELVTVVYELSSTVSRPTIGQAIPSYAPDGSGKFFRKLECFCFKQQALEANQTREFPVVFVVDPKLPADVTTITLSYTFFEVAGQPGVKPSAGAPVQGS
ncbi:MAG: cytochrome c oxidase assembly protein [Burkholderiales bacterium]